jgi:hypothetical protein
VLKERLRKCISDPPALPIECLVLTSSREQILEDEQIIEAYLRRGQIKLSIKVEMQNMLCLDICDQQLIWIKWDKKLTQKEV